MEPDEARGEVPVGAAQGAVVVRGLVETAFAQVAGKESPTTSDLHVLIKNVPSAGQS